MLSRRTFFGKIVGILTSGYIISKFTYGSQQTEQNIQVYLTKAFNQHTKGKGASGPPKQLNVSQELFDKYESTLVACQRFTPYDELPATNRWLSFKATRMQVDPNLTGWSYRFEG